MSTLGEMVKYHREKKKYSLEELSARTKIRCKLLECLERNQYSKLPKRVYLVGFIKTLSQELDMSFSDALISLDEAKVNDVTFKYVHIKKTFKYDFFLFVQNKVFVRQSARFLLIGVSFFSLVFALFSFVKNLSRSAFLVRVDHNVESLNSRNAKEVSLHRKDLTSENINKMVELVIRAIHGDSWIAYKVDQLRIVKLVLKKGRVLELKGKQVRLVVGNHQVLNIFNSGKQVSVSKKNHSSTAHLVFPVELSRKYKEPYFVFNQEDGSVMTRKEFEEKIKGI